MSNRTLFSSRPYGTLPLAALLGLFLLLTACVRQVPPGTPAPPTTAHELWNRYASVCAAGMDAARPYRLQMSLRYGTEGDTRRVTALIWGNSDKHLRLDVSAGVGVMVASIMEDGDHFLVYAPNEQRAYFHQGAQKPLLSVGVPVPFGLGDLAALLSGRYGEVFGVHQSGEALLRPDGNIVYTLAEAPKPGTLELDAQGLPVLWQDGGKGKDGGWSLNIAYDDSPTPLPRRLEITHTGGQRAIVLVKERDYPSSPFTDAQLGLTIPEDTPVLPLRQFRAQR